MEALYFWLLMFAGAAMIAVGICLLISERELRKQRREVGELVTRNKKLVESVSALSGQLEESKRIVEEFQREQRQLENAAELKPQLQASQETIKKLEIEQERLLDQLHAREFLLRQTTSQYKEVADRNERLEFDLDESRQQLDKLTMENNELLEMTNSLSSQLAVRDRTVEEFQTLKHRLAGIQSENQQLQTENQALQQEIANLKTQPGTTESHFNEAVAQAREITEHNTKLQTEVSELNRQLQASQKMIKEPEQQRLGSKRDIQMPKLVCPKCSSDHVERVSRIGSERLISLFYIYPFRCEACGYRFRRLRWGVRYTKIE